MTSVDITPSPRVLRMLGQIDFAPWQCLAELIDNSVDAFIDQVKSGSPPVNPTIKVLLPTDAQLKAGNGQIVISDNGPGMTLDQITNAVRAGYSGNDPVEKMGLFGMGFNISTARLGRRTEVWSTTVDSDHWVGLVIDFELLERTRAFNAPVETRHKTSDELNRPTHGTQIVVSRLESDRTRALMWGIGKRKTKDRLGKIYGRVMTRLDIAILYDGDRIKAWKHCIWDEKRAVDTQSFGRVPAVLHINETLPSSKFCTTCWVWLTPGDTECPSCGHAKNVIERERRLRGWIGIQRFFDKSHYGIDLIRNGRVIEELDKSFFTYTDESGESIFEYPIDATHWGGRIVGELEIDFVRVSHQKDSFDKLDPEWKKVVEIVRGRSPLQPRIAERMNLPKNGSHLARLFSGYRKGTAGLKDLVPGNAKGVGLNTGVVLEYREKFYEGEAAFQSDEKWYELVLQVERAKRGDSSGADEAAGDFPFDSDVEDEGEGEDGSGVPGGGSGGVVPPAGPGATPNAEPAAIEKDVELSRTYELKDLPGQPAIRVDAYRHSADISGLPYTIKPDGFAFRFDYNGRASFFEESLETPLDYLLIDLAHHFLSVSAESIRLYPVSRAVRQLREVYFPGILASVSNAVDASESLLQELRRHFDENLHEHAPVDASKIDEAELAHIRQAAFKAENASSAAVAALIESGRFARYVSPKFLPHLVRGWPAVAMDGRFFVVPYSTIDSKVLQEIAVEDVSSCLQDVLWLREDGGTSVSKDIAWRLRFSRALASLRMLENWRT